MTHLSGYLGVRISVLACCWTAHFVTKAVYVYRQHSVFLTESLCLILFLRENLTSFPSLRSLQATAHACTPGAANNARRTAVLTAWHMINFASTMHDGLPSEKLGLQATAKGSGRTE